MAVGNESTPVYIDDDGIARECTAVTPSGTTASIKRFQSTADATGQYTWFEVWPDGWVKQGGCVKVTSGAGNQVTVTFPVEFRDMLYQPHVSTTDMSAGYSEPATPVGTGNEHSLGRCTTSTMCLQVQSGYSTSQMFFWTAEGYRNPLKDIPTGYTETAISLTGVSSTGGGVIDGTLWEDPTIVAVTSTGAKEITYAVKHNCYLGINMRQLLNPNDTSICAYVNGVLVWKIGEMEASAESSDDLCHGIPVKAGSSIKVTFSVSTLHTGASVVFSEFKLHALDPQIAMPDYNRMTDKTADIEATGGWIATEAGYIVTNAITATNTGTPVTIHLSVNEKTVFQAYDHGSGSFDCVPFDVIPVNKGDVIIAPSGHKLAHETYAFNFAPCKANIIEISSENGGCGVVDGTVLTEKVWFTKEIAGKTGDATLVYTVQNDCAVGLFASDYDNGSVEGCDHNCKFYFDAARTKPIIGTIDTADYGSAELHQGWQGGLVPVKKGTVIFAACENLSSSRVIKFKFVEYQLKAANIKVDAQVGMPDWDSSKKVQIETGDVIGVKPGTCDGYIVYSTQAGSLKINGVDVMVESAQYHDGMYVVPVSVNDVVTFAAGEDCRFYPAKAIPAKLSELTMGTPDWNNAERLAMTANVELVMSRDGFVNACAGHNDCRFWVNGVSIAYDDTAAGCDCNLVPVSVGDKLKCSKTFSKTDDISNNDAYAWFIPRKKVQIDVSDFVPTNTGGVISGEYHRDTGWIAIGDGSKTSYEYTVQNDCLLAISTYDDSATGNQTEVLYISNGTITTYLGSITDGDGQYEQNTFHVPVKKGTTIVVKERGLKSTDATDLAIPAALRARFIEFVLNVASIKVNAQSAMSDWDTVRKTTLYWADDLKTYIDSAKTKFYTAERDEIAYVSAEWDSNDSMEALKLYLIPNGSTSPIEIYYSRQSGTGDHVAHISASVSLTKGDRIYFQGMTGTYPVRQGSELAQVISTALKATPAKLSELYMGAPNYSAEYVEVTTGYVAEKDGWLQIAWGGTITQTSSGYVQINGVTVAAMTYASTIGLDSQCSVVPISAGDTVTIVTNGDTTCQCRLYPRKKIQIDASDITAVGGGVIDGTQFTDTYKIVPYTTWTDDTKKNSDGEWEYKYEVQNDCLFYANFLVHAHSTAFDLVTIKLNDVIFDYYTESQYSNNLTTYFQTLQLPLKKGTVVKFCSKSKPDHNQIFNLTDAKIEAFAIKHAEYKLTAIAPQVAFPDWDTNKKENVTVFPYTVSKNGYLYICVANVGSEAYVYVNGQEVHYACTASYGDSCGVVPVSKGDVVTVGGSFASAAVHSVTFYPAKVIQQEGSSSSGGFVGMDLARATAVALPYQATEDGWFNVEMNSTSTSGYIQLSEDGTNWVNIICTRSSDTHIVPMCKGQWVRGSSLNIRSGGIGPQFIPAKKSS